MSFVLGVVLSLLVSFAVVWVPRGASPTMPEFWVTPVLYGLPVLCLAWPLYFQLFKRLRKRPWWQLAIVGALLSPLAFATLLIGEGVLKGSLLPSERPWSYYVPWNSVFTYWYAIFGLLLGAYFGIVNRRSATILRHD